MVILSSGHATTWSAIPEGACSFFTERGIDFSMGTLLLTDMENVADLFPMALVLRIE
jgi:hypothetical protein